MIRIISILVVAAALAYPMSALSANPDQPNRFELSATMSDIHNCVRVGEFVTYAVHVTNISNHYVIATVSPDSIGNDQYSFQYESSKPRINSTTTSIADPNGSLYSYTTWQWQQRIKPGRSATFNVTVKVPDWNFPASPFTDPTTGQVYYPPAPQPFPREMFFDIGVLGSTGSTATGARSAYC